MFVWNWTSVICIGYIVQFTYMEIQQNCMIYIFSFYKILHVLIIIFMLCIACVVRICLFCRKRNNSLQESSKQKCFIGEMLKEIKNFRYIYMGIFLLKTGIKYNGSAKLLIFLSFKRFQGIFWKKIDFLILLESK